MISKMNHDAVMQPNLSASALVSLINTIHVALLVLDRKTGEILLVNDLFCEDTMIEREHLIGSKYSDVCWEEFNLVLDGLVAKSDEGGYQSTVYYWTERSMWGQMYTRRISWIDGRPAVVVSITNITELGKSEYEYKRMAYFDSHLSLPNGKQLEADIRTIASFKDTTLIHFDIKQFSVINDLYGWDTGDYLLAQIRDWLLSTARPICQLYRISEDEFCLLIRNISLRDAKKRADEVMKRFTQPWKQLEAKNQMPLYCTIVMGMVYGEPLKDDIRNLLYRTIHGPQNTERFTLYDSRMDKKTRDQLFMRQSLVACVQQDMLGFDVFYQPVIEAGTGRWAGAEALCRWNMPGHGRVSPLLFINQAEEIGLIEQIDTWVLQTAMTNCTKWGLVDKPFFLDVNVSPKQNVDEEFIRRLTASIAACNFPNNQLNLEITESNKFDFSIENIKRWERLRDAGVTISLDDFGTGYSSFNNLVKLPASILKTEKAFIDNLEKDEYLQYLLQVMINLAHTLKMQIIAEGVETEGQKKLLTDYGVDFMQGYLFSKPLSPSQFKKVLHNYSV